MTCILLGVLGGAIWSAALAADAWIRRRRAERARRPFHGVRVPDRMPEEVP